MIFLLVNKLNLSAGVQYGAKKKPFDIADTLGGNSKEAFVIGLTPKVKGDKPRLMIGSKKKNLC